MRLPFRFVRNVYDTSQSFTHAFGVLFGRYGADEWRYSAWVTFVRAKL